MKILLAAATLLAVNLAHAEPRVLVLATEQLGPQRIFGWADVVWDDGGMRSHTTAVREVSELGGIEAKISEAFASSGYDVVDPHVLHGRLRPKPAFERLDLSLGEAEQVATRADAELVVIAKGVAQSAYHPMLDLGGMTSGQANVVARLVRVRDGKVLASTSQHAAQVHIDPTTARQEALDEAARLAAQALLQQLDR
jgi:hypothetical protein